MQLLGHFRQAVSGVSLLLSELPVSSCSENNKDSKSFTPCMGVNIKCYGNWYTLVFKSWSHAHEISSSQGARGLTNVMFLEHQVNVREIADQQLPQHSLVSLKRKVQDTNTSGPSKTVVMILNSWKQVSTEPTNANMQVPTQLTILKIPSLTCFLFRSCVNLHPPAP